MDRYKKNYLLQDVILIFVTYCIFINIYSNDTCLNLYNKIIKIAENIKNEKFFQKACPLILLF